MVAVKLQICSRSSCSLWCSFLVRSFSVPTKISILTLLRSLLSSLYSLLELGPIVFGPTDHLIAWLRSKRLLAQSQDCTSCNLPMRQGTRRDVTDGLVWHCPSCKTTKSIREGSFFFTKSRLSLKKWLLLLHFWMKEYPVSDAASDLQVDNNTACDVYQWLREVCSVAEQYSSRWSWDSCSSRRVSISTQTEGSYTMMK